ncbi:uncharacterized protein A4U43_C07F8660 [Asparagus officinalis]|uniref:Uncharacterized protein n=1 Tax=Asparagus officinalis TaxID=4686 RepID=A0A5P1EDG4_ASPOF|nr:uncharacterized protein A4U43_C07F8660 [Asparagus officinalis]
MAGYGSGGGAARARGGSEPVRQWVEQGGAWGSQAATVGRGRRKRRGVGLGGELGAVRRSGETVRGWRRAGGFEVLGWWRMGKWSGAEDGGRVVSSGSLAADGCGGVGELRARRGPEARVQGAGLWAVA